MSAVVFVLFVATIWTRNILANDEKPRESPIKWIESMHEDHNKIPLEVRRFHRLNKKHEVCWTHECNNAANRFLENMNLSADPCDDFYEYVCGNFIEKNPVPQNKAVTTFEIASIDIKTRLKMLLENSSPVNEPRPLRLAKEFYNTCMDESKIKEVGLSYIKKVLKRIGGWPVLEGTQWDSSKFTWEDAVWKLNDEGFDADIFLLGVKVGLPAAANSRRRIIVLDQPQKPDINDAELYVSMMYLAQTFGADVVHVKKEINDIKEFQDQLAKISSPAEERPNSIIDEIYNPMTVLELQESFPSIPWVEYFSNIFPKTVKVQPNDIVNVRDISYIKNLENLLTITPKRTQANYIAWRAALYAHPYYTEIPHIVSRSKYCVDITLDSLPFASSALYAKHFFNSETNRKANEMVDCIHEELYELLKQEDWLDDETKKNALDKAKAIQTSFIAYPKVVIDDEELEMYYEKLEITQGNFLKSKLNTTKTKKYNNFNQLRKPVKKSDWDLNPETILQPNAFYNRQANTIMITAGALHDTLFSVHVPSYLNYGCLGFLVGHELSHGFDDKGSNYGKFGLKDWWNPMTKEVFHKRIQCIIDQYGNYSVNGQNLNGTLTQGENIADNGGIKLAYLGYNRWVDEHGTEKRLPGMEDFTPHQMFWISAARTWCSNYDPEYLSKLVKTDEHTPGQFRIIGMFSNQPEFAKDFKCPIGSKMNPINKCEVW